MKVFRVAFAFVTVLSAAARLYAVDNPVFKELGEKGVPLTNGEVGKLPPPALADGLTAAEQKQAITAVVKAGEIGRGFMKGGKNDAWHYNQTDIRSKANKPKDAIGRQIDLYFIAQGSFSTVADQKFMKQQVKQGNNNDPKKGSAEFYTDDELKAHELKVVDEKTMKDRYAHFFFPLFSMVEISGTGYGVETIEKESVLVAFKLDPKFAKDPKYPNEWRSLGKNAIGGIVKGNPNPYEGAGGYVKVTELKDQETPRLFVEYHLIFDEPYGWFNGAPTLSSKLPLKFDEDVKQFRADLKEFEKKNPPMQNNPPNKPVNNPPKK